MTQEMDDDDLSDPVAAFDALRLAVETHDAEMGLEMANVRKGFETACDQLKQFQQSIDYGADLGRIVKQLAEVSERLGAIEQTPVLRQGAEHYARALSADLGRMVKQFAEVSQRLEAIEQTPVLRQGAEPYPRALSADLGRVMKQLAEVSQRLGAIEQTPVVRPADLLERSDEGLVLDACRRIEQHADNLQRLTGDFARHGGSVRDRQDWWLGGAGTAGLVLGVLSTLFLPGVLPGSVDAAVAAMVMRADRWHAGGALMESASPGDWRSIVEATKLVRANKEALSPCIDVAAKAKREQKCTITVAPSPQDIARQTPGPQVKNQTFVVR